jgi:hypothetical protein
MAGLSDWTEIALRAELARRDEARAEAEARAAVEFEEEITSAVTLLEANGYLVTKIRSKKAVTK